MYSFHAMSNFQYSIRSSPDAACAIGKFQQPIPVSAAAGDWLQGPYVYHLYEYYGYSVRDIGRLFIMGFGSSAVFGTLAGAMADRK